jgi:hypothetical protein
LKGSFHCFPLCRLLGCGWLLLACLDKAVALV